VSERDVVQALARRRDPSTTTAIEIAHTQLVWCDADSPVAEVAEEMMEHYVRHVLVEDAGRVVGIVSARDLLGAYAAAEVPGDEQAE
jgi:CBS domain-containing protein